ncbi:glycosyl hydrolase family 8 [Teichococcus oryzae]|uniref:glycosyl hydrolase family 8 n=1 Tax=Teichococcus oryzae TaxID=1608942 RepID=UPI001376100C|nr:glycosyl hydrolase family 8 [Pseudoroseomonas oryzae]
MSRRAMLAVLASAPGRAAHAAAPQPGAGPTREMLAAWQSFRQDFLRPDGRVVDSGNQGVSHSEGQGWAMFCAERCADRASFDLIWSWTRRVLARPGDHLLAWRFVPESAPPVADGNNATDGDLFAATALLLAARRWNHAPYAESGAAIAGDILRLLVRHVAGQAVLLPGAQGFEDAGSVTLNPSYYAFPVLAVLARAVPDPIWLAIAEDGLALLRRARFGAWGLPPDWVVLEREGGALSLPERWPPRFSYDAVRVPLYLRWAGLRDEPALRAAAAFWRRPGQGAAPAWVDLRSNRTAPYPASSGVQALAGWITEQGNRSSRDTQGDYYSSILKLMTRCAAASSPYAG